MAVESHQDLNLPYIDPFTARARRISDAGKSELSRVKHSELFARFVETIRKKEPFLRKATEQELEGIFVRLTPAEKIKYGSEEIVTKPVKRRSVIDDFLADELEENDGSLSSDDVSLVSESDQLSDSSAVKVHKEKHKKAKKAKKEKKEKSVSKMDPSMIKKFTWA